MEDSTTVHGDHTVFNERFRRSGVQQRDRIGVRQIDLVERRSSLEHDPPERQHVRILFPDPVFVADGDGES